MRRIILWGVSLGMFLVCLCVSRPAWSQQTTAAITGTVVDAGGAAVNGATITATDTDRGTSYTAKTDSGIFNLARVPIGNYQVKAEAAGFQSSIQNGLTLVLNQTARLEFKMNVGAVTNTVQVTSEAPQLQSDTTQVSTLIDANTIIGIPLATRNYVAVDACWRRAASLLTIPRLTTATTRQAVGGPSSMETASNPTTSSWTAWTTTRPRITCWAYTPSPDAIQEFNLITSNAPAEFGNFLGGIVNASIKSGTNQFHGDVWEFFRNDVLNANQWENKFNPGPTHCPARLCAGICLVARSAARSGKTSCSSSWTIRDSVSITRRPAASSPSSRTAERAGRLLVSAPADQAGPACNPITGDLTRTIRFRCRR